MLGDFVSIGYFVGEGITRKFAGHYQSEEVPRTDYDAATVLLKVSFFLEREYLQHAFKVEVEILDFDWWFVRHVKRFAPTVFMPTPDSL
jgi:hypothetical protein